MLDRLDRLIDETMQRLTQRWWVWPLGLVALALSTWVASVALTVGSDEFCYLGATRMGDTCLLIRVFGIPCPSCGMTRSFVWASRGALLHAFVYNPAGLALFVWISLGGVVGAVRLATRDPSRLQLPWEWMLRWVLFWFFALYTLPWVLRLAGINPLP